MPNESLKPTRIDAGFVLAKACDRAAYLSVKCRNK